VECSIGADFPLSSPLFFAPLVCERTEADYAVTLAGRSSRSTVTHRLLTDHHCRTTFADAPVPYRPSSIGRQLRLDTQPTSSTAPTKQTAEVAGGVW
jgi:hypothetical protein